MHRLQSARRPSALLLAFLGWVGLALQLYVTIGNAAANGKSALAALIIFASYFTILTNILAAASMTWSSFTAAASRPSPPLLSAIALYMFVVGIVYTLLLCDLWSPAGLQWLADQILHTVAPVLIAVYWLLFVPKGTLRWMQPFYWMIYPLAYLALSLVRGASTGFYPYPFLDVAAAGYSRVAGNAFGLTVACLLLAYMLVAFDHMLAFLQNRAER